MGDSGRVDPFWEYIDMSKVPALDLFNREIVTITKEQRDDAISHRWIAQTKDVMMEWDAGEWKMPMIPLVGPTSILIEEHSFLDALPELGTDHLAYNAKQNWVCRQFGFAAAVVVSAALEVNVGIIVDVDGEHLYSFIPVYRGEDIKILVFEPQLDRVVEHTDPQHHYTGDRAGYALLI